MRILMLNNEFPPLGGGTGIVNQTLFNYFKDLPDLTIDLITSALGKHYEQERFSERITLYKVPVNNRNLQGGLGVISVNWVTLLGESVRTRYPWT
jgi:phosphatidyl-myo-inositol dimannoside synthase